MPEIRQDDCQPTGQGESGNLALPQFPYTPAKLSTETHALNCFPGACITVPSLQRGTD